MLAKVANFREDVRPEVQAASDYILKPPVNLFLQALTTFDVLHHVISDDVLLPTEALRAWLVFLDRGWKRSFSGVPLLTDIARLDRHVAKVQEAEVTSSRLSHWHGYP